MTIESADVTTMRTTSPTAMLTIFLLIDCRIIARRPHIRLWKSKRKFRLSLPRAAVHQRRTDQHAIGTFGQGRRLVQPEPRQAGAVGGVRLLPKSLPQHSRQTPWRTCGFLQELQRRNQPLLDLGEIASERK